MSAKFEEKTWMLITFQDVWLGLTARQRWQPYFASISIFAGKQIGMVEDQCWRKALVYKFQSCCWHDFFFQGICYIQKNTDLNCAVVHYLTISVWNTYQEQLKMDTKIWRLWCLKDSV
jgi:hypothetical protein